MIEIYEDPLLGTEIAFRGGTALHKLLFDAPRRYSEDIDLVQVHAGPIGPIMNAVRARLDPWLGKPTWKHRHGRVTLVYRFASEAKPVTPLRLKVEINTREHFTALGHARCVFQVMSPWFNGATEILTYSPEELLATKLRALYQRKKGRDLFDLSEALDNLSGLDVQKVIDCFAQYIRRDETRISRAEFEANLVEKIADEAFANDVLPLLSSGVTFNPKRALKNVRTAFISRLPGEPWKGDG